jgi:hypothetical protein
MSQERYEAKIGQMLAKSREWKAANPQRSAVIVFNYPPDVSVAMMISRGIELGYVKPDEAGLELIQYLAPWGVHDEPTVNMVRGVIEHETKE